MTNPAATFIHYRIQINSKVLFKYYFIMNSYTLTFPGSSFSPDGQRTIPGKSPLHLDLLLGSWARPGTISDSELNQGRSATFVLRIFHINGLFGLLTSEDTVSGSPGIGGGIKSKLLLCSLLVTR